MKAQMEKAARAWRGFRRLRSAERGVAMEAAAILLATRAGLRFAGFNGWKRALELFTPSAHPGASEPPLSAAHTIARIEEAAANYAPFRPNCLERSLALWWLLQRRGISAEVRAGARKAGSRFEAHAWVEWRGTVLMGEDEEGSFVPFDGPVTMGAPAR
ncbi:MAG TPA: lasso peptide biosynthesis B2 protein [Candidatus Acidoferrales bacterium]|nr:lasso peptide biosynthesis B2 protein [Candidatus Acidoferrales bacterium]